MWPVLKFRSAWLKSIGHSAAALCLAVTAACGVAARADEAPSLDVMEAISIADEAYIYGFGG